MDDMYKPIPFSPVAVLASDISASATIIPVSDITAFPAPPSYATIGDDTNAETIIYTAITGNSLSGCVRGVEGTAQEWNSGEHIARNFTAADHQAIIDNLLSLEAGLAQAYSPTNKPTAADVGARPNTWTPNASDVGALSINGGTMNGIISNNGYGMAVYTYSTQQYFFNVIGLSGTKTMAQIVSAMPNNSMFKFTHNNALTGYLISGLPHGYGQLIIMKGYNDSYANGFFFVQNSGSANTGDVYAFVYNANVGEVWYKIGSRDGFLPLSGGTLTGELVINRNSQTRLSIVRSGVNRMFSVWVDGDGFANFRSTNTAAAADEYIGAYFGRDVNSTSNYFSISLKKASDTSPTYYPVYGRHNLVSLSNPTYYDLPNMPTGWASNGMSKYWKDLMGYVHISCKMYNANSGSSIDGGGGTVFTLPTGYRPSQTIEFVGGIQPSLSGTSKVFATFKILTSGTVELQCINNCGGYLYFDATFYAG